MMDGAEGKDKRYPEAGLPTVGTDPEQPRMVSFMRSIVPRNNGECEIWVDCTSSPALNLGPQEPRGQLLERRVITGALETAGGHLSRWGEHVRGCEGT